MNRIYYAIIDKNTNNIIRMLLKDDFKLPYYKKYIDGLRNKVYAIKVFN